MAGAKDFTLEVTGREELGPHFVRLHVNDGGLLAACGVHPTMWIRLWFDRGGKAHQRAFTLVDPDPEAGTFSLDFALHEGSASDWARGARPGDTLEATVQGSRFDLPEPHPERVFAVGDPASIPAINSLLETVNGAPAVVLMEYVHEEDRNLPVATRPGDRLQWVPRGTDGQALVDAVSGAVSADSVHGHYFWLSCEAASVRSISKYLRKDLGVDRKRIMSMAYWRS